MRKYDWEFTVSPRPQNETVTVYNDAYNVPNFKEALSNNVYFWKRKFIESDGVDAKSLYYAEAYQRLLDLMVRSHKLAEKRVEDIKKERNANEVNVI